MLFEFSSFLIFIHFHWTSEGVNQNFFLSLSFSSFGISIGSVRLHFISFASASHSNPKSFEVWKLFLLLYKFEEETKAEFESKAEVEKEL